MPPERFKAGHGQKKSEEVKAKSGQKSGQKKSKRLAAEHDSLQDVADAAPQFDDNRAPPGGEKRQKKAKDLLQVGVDRQGESEANQASDQSSDADPDQDEDGVDGQGASEADQASDQSSDADPDEDDDAEPEDEDEETVLTGARKLNKSSVGGAVVAKSSLKKAGPANPEVIQRQAPASSPGMTADRCPARTVTDGTGTQPEAQNPLAKIATKSGMHALTKWAKPYCYNSGAAPHLADGSGRARAERLQMVVTVIQAQNLFGMRTPQRLRSRALPTWTILSSRNFTLLYVSQS